MSEDRKTTQNRLRLAKKLAHLMQKQDALVSELYTVSDELLKMSGVGTETMAAVPAPVAKPVKSEKVKSEKATAKPATAQPAEAPVKKKKRVRK